MLQYIPKNGIGQNSFPGAFTDNYTSVVKLNRTEPLRNDLQFVLWSLPANSGHPIITHPNVTVMARVRIDAINADKPPSYPDYAINNITYSQQNGVALGKRWADWLEFQGLTKGKGNLGTGNLAGGVFAQNHGSVYYAGSISGRKGLFMHPDDLLDGIYPVGWHANSSLRNQGTLSDGSLTVADYIQVAFQTLKQECDIRNVCYPAYLAWDWEEKFGSSDIIGTGTITRAHLYPASGYPLPTFARLQADPRYNTEVIYEEYTPASGWVGKTYADAFAEAGSPAESSGVTWFQGINRDWTMKMYNTFLQIWDHVLNETVYEPAKEQFPNIICGNYQIIHPISSGQTDQFWEWQNNFLRIPDFNQPTGTRYLRGDYHSPVCYCPDMRNLSSRYIPANNVAPPAPRYTNHVFGSTSGDIYINYCTQIVKSVAISGNLPQSIVPWIEPGYEDTHTGNWGAGNSYNASSGDILQLCLNHYNLGVRTWMVFSPSFSSLFAWQDPLLTPSDRATIFMDTINSLRTSLYGGSGSPNVGGVNILNVLSELRKGLSVL